MSRFIDRVGESVITKQGYKMTIIEYNSARDFAVEFEDGIVCKHTSYKSFKQGLIKYPNIKIGRKSISNQGLEMTIVGYRSASDIDVQFENGVVVYNKHISSFNKGQIKCPSYRVGEKRINNQGLLMTLIKDK